MSATTDLDRNAASGTRKRRPHKRDRPPSHRPAPSPRTLGNITRDEDGVIGKVLERVRGNWRNSACHTWVLCSATGDVSTVTEAAATASYLESVWDDVAGAFGRSSMAPGEAPRWPTADEVREAIADVYPRSKA